MGEAVAGNTDRAIPPASAGYRLRRRAWTLCQSSHRVFRPTGGNAGVQERLQEGPAPATAMASVTAGRDVIDGPGSRSDRRSDGPQGDRPTVADVHDPPFYRSWHSISGIPEPIIPGPGTSWSQRFRDCPGPKRGRSDAPLGPASGPEFDA